MVPGSSCDASTLRVTWASFAMPDTTVVAFAVTEPVILLYGHEKTASALEA